MTILNLASYLFWFFILFVAFALIDLKEGER